MSVSSSKLSSKHTPRGSLREQNKSRGVDIQQKTHPTASRPQSIERQFTDDDQDADSKEAGRRESPLINQGCAGVQRGTTPDLTVQQKRPVTVSRPQSVSLQFIDDVKGAKSREAGHGESLLTNRKGGGDAQHKPGAETNPGRSVQRKAPPAVSRVQDVGRRTDNIHGIKSREAGGSEPSFIDNGSGDVRRQETGGRVTPNHPIKQKVLPTGSRLEPVGRHGTSNVRDTRSKESGCGESSLTNSGSGGAQRRKIGSKVTPGRPIQQNILPNTSRLQSVGRRTNDVQHAQSKGARSKGAEGRTNPDDSVPIEAPIAKEPSVTMLQGASNFQISNANFTAIGGNATIIRFGDGQFTDVQRDLIGDYIATFAALPGINDNINKHFLNQLIINLPRAEAVFNDYQTKKKSGPCFEGTRVALLREIADWVTGQEGSRMYILSGLAGIGKSTVAYTIASRAADLNLLGASFFFSRDEADRNNAKKFFTTIAYQLCVYDQGFAKAIGDALLTERGSAAVTKDPQEQLRALILDPLRDIVQSRVRPTLVIIDALDECCEADVRGVIQGLGLLAGSLPLFKVILTTRPQPYLHHFLRSQTSHKLFHLQDIEDKIIDSDIRLYLKHNLSLENIQEYYPWQQWFASDEEINSLVRTAGRLFIIASTTVRYILDKLASNPEARMQKLLRAYALDHTPFKDLDRIYTVILRNVVPEDCDDNDIISRYQSVVGAIILARHPVSVSTLAHLMNIDEEEIHAVLSHLRSVILLGDDDIPRVYHKSFPDYLADKTRCKDSKLLIDPKIQHRRIVTRCFEIVNKHLKYNILGLGTPARFMNNEDSLKMDGITEEQLEEKIPQRLRYACVYWVAHLELASIEDSDIIHGLDKFVNRHTLHWFEVLSLIGKLDLAHSTIRAVLNLLPLTSSCWYQILSDALHFISKFYEVINRSALHIYYSALPFSPTDTLLYRQYVNEAEDGICDVEGGPQNWDAVVASLNHVESIDVVKFSANSAMLVSYTLKFVAPPPFQSLSRMGKLNIWEATTGMPISTIPGDRFAISNDFSMIISSKDNIITYYDLEGTPTGNTVITSSGIKMLALSCQSNRVAAGLFDGTVCLWESTHRKFIVSLNGYDDRQHLRFSPSGTRLVYSSANGIVKLQDGISGRFIADLQCGSWNQLELSGDGSRIASLSKDCGLKLWNSESGGLIGAIGDVGHMVLAISANGSLLATADDHNVTLWRENCDQLIQIKILECTFTDAIAFSLDNKSAICDSFGIKIYNIETDTISTLLSKQSRGPLAFSPDGTRLACGALLCDAQAIDTSISPSRASASPLNSIALSRNCSRLSCAFLDGRVELWGTSPTMQRISSHRASSLGRNDMCFAPDGRLFASWPRDSPGIIELWNSGDGSLLGTLNVDTTLSTVALSNRMLIAGGDGAVTLWDPDALSLLHTFTVDLLPSRASISDQGDLAAIIFPDNSVHLFDLENRITTRILTNSLKYYEAQCLKFLPDKSYLVARSANNEFRSLNLANEHITSGPMLKHLIQLPDTPIWHGTPTWLCRVNGQHCVVALFSQDQDPVPVLWIPADVPVQSQTHGPSMFALGCSGGRIIVLRLRTRHAD